MGWRMPFTVPTGSPERSETLCVVSKNTHKGKMKSELTE